MGEATFGKYRLIAELGHGGMADVFLAVQAGPAGSNFRKLTVIKRLRKNLVEQPEFVEMLIEEARIAARLNHPNVVQTNEVGQVEEQYFIAMEYLDGQPLHRIQHRTASRVKEGKPPTIAREQQMIIVMDALAGLHHAHDLTDYDGSPLEIVHRDVTPQNIFVTYEGQVKVVDFGIAKAAGRASETRQGVIKGKVRYMAPEQAIGQHVDRRADVFSVGVMLWEVAANRRMWKDVDDLEIVRQLLDGTYPISPRAIHPSCPEGLDRICQKALAQNRDDRYATADDFRSDLEEFLAESGNLVEARRKLAPAVIDLFLDKRSEIRAVIEQQLAALDVQASGEFQAVRIAGESGSSSMHFAQTMGPVSVPSGPNAATALAGVPDQTRPPRRQLVNRLATAGVVGLMAVAVGVVAWRANPRGAAASAVPAVDQISVRFRATPASAKIVIDDAPPRSAPVELRVPKDGRNHRVRFEAEGHVVRTEVVRFDADLAISVALQPIPLAVPVVAPEPVAAAAPVVQRPTIVSTRSVAAVAAVPTPIAEPAPAATTDMPAKERKKPKTELDNGDPWATK